MRQSRFVLVGVLDAALVGVLGAAFGPAVFGEPGIVALLAAGVAITLAGVFAHVQIGRVRVSWRGFLASSYLSFAAMWLLLAVPDDLSGAVADDERVFLAVAALNAAVFAGFAVLARRGDHHLDVTTDVDRTLTL